MKIKTIVSPTTVDFDARCNEAFDDGWRLAKRDILMPTKAVEAAYYYAELVKVDEAPAPDPLEALRVVRDFCEEMPREKCLGACPLTPWCAMYCADDDLSPADWVVPEEVGA